MAEVAPYFFLIAVLIGAYALYAAAVGWVLLTVTGLPVDTGKWIVTVAVAIVAGIAMGVGLAQRVSDRVDSALYVGVPIAIEAISFFALRS
jgi:hypothetical protein